MDYRRGLQALRECLKEAGAQRLSELATLENRWQENQSAEQIFGSSENTRNEHAQIIFALNKLALEHCGVSFNELCMGKHASTQPQTPASDPEVIERLRRIEEKIDQGRAEDRQSAAQTPRRHCSEPVRAGRGQQDDG